MRRRLPTNMGQRGSLRTWLDEWLGTLARYLGIILVVYAVLVDRFRNPALLPAATGLIFYRNVAGK